MLSYKTLIIEDNPADQQLLQTHLARLPYINLRGTFASALEAVPVLHKEAIDLLFLDVMLPGMDGLTFLASLHQPPRVILTTVDPTYALTAYEAGVVDYLLKPYTFERLLKAMSRAIGLAERQLIETQLHHQSSLYVFLKTGREAVRVATSDILYAEAFGAFSKVYTPSAVLVVSELLADLQQQLPAGAFIRVHKSYLVALDNITRISTRYVTVHEQQIPLGATYREQVEKALRN